MTPRSIQFVLRPEGFITLEREDGSWREGFCLDGVWDGLVREFDSDRNMKVSEGVISVICSHCV